MNLDNLCYNVSLAQNPDSAWNNLYSNRRKADKFPVNFYWRFT